MIAGCPKRGKSEISRVCSWIQMLVMMSMVDLDEA